MFSIPAPTSTQNSGTCTVPCKVPQKKSSCQEEIWRKHCNNKTCLFPSFRKLQNSLKGKAPCPTSLQQSMKKHRTCCLLKFHAEFYLMLSEALQIQCMPFSIFQKYNNSCKQYKALFLMAFFHARSTITWQPALFSFTLRTRTQLKQAQSTELSGKTHGLPFPAPCKPTFAFFSLWQN